LVRIPETLPAKVMPPYKAYYLLNNGPQISHVEVFTSDGKLVSVSEIPVIFKVSLTESSEAVKRRNGLADRGTSTSAFAQFSALSPVNGWFSSLNAFSRRFLTAQARIRYQVSRGEICGGQCGIGTGFSQNTSVFPFQYNSTNAPYSSSSTGCYYRTDKWTKPGIFQKAAFSLK
jgi:hypothetical protein